MRADFVLVVQAGGSTRRFAYEGCTSNRGEQDSGMSYWGDGIQLVLFLHRE